MARYDRSLAIPLLYKRFAKRLNVVGIGFAVEHGPGGESGNESGNASGGEADKTAEEVEEECERRDEKIDDERHELKEERKHGIEYCGNRIHIKIVSYPLPRSSACGDFLGTIRTN